jgi:DMSO reductase family type II enzyme heme b subunit
MGAAGDPVYQWRWTSSAEGGSAVAGVARGIDQFAPQGAGPGARATHDKGQWKLVLTRSLATADTVNQLQFGTGRAIPLAFFAWDGGSGERGARMALSTWYFLALDTPTPAGTYISPLVAMVLTLGLGLVVVRRAQRRNSAGGTGRTV